MISITTPSIRPEMLDMVLQCIRRQNFPEYEWIIVGNEAVEEWHDKHFNNQWFPMIFIEEPKKREADFYSLNKAWNAAFKNCNHDLIINIVDGIYFPPDTLEKLWQHYQINHKSCVSAIGHQYDRMEHNKPEHMVWRDPRARSDQGSFYEVNELEFELCLASFPRQAVMDIGGIDADNYDRAAACSEKEMALRMYTAGYKLYLDQTIEYRALSHPRIGGSEKWDKHYEIACQLFDKHRREIAEGIRLKLNYL